MTQPEWVKSSCSFSNGNCVQVARLPGATVGVRDSNDPNGPILVLTPRAWAAFTRRLQAGLALGRSS